MLVNFRSDSRSRRLFWRVGVVSSTLLIKLNLLQVSINNKILFLYGKIFQHIFRLKFFPQLHFYLRSYVRINVVRVLNARAEFWGKTTSNQTSAEKSSPTNLSKILRMRGSSTISLKEPLYKSGESEVRNDSSKCATEGARLLVVKRGTHLPTIWDTGEP